MSECTINYIASMKQRMETINICIRCMQWYFTNESWLFGWSVVYFEVIQSFLSFISIHLGNIGAEKYNELNIQVNEWLKNLFHDKSFAWI